MILRMLPLTYLNTIAFTPLLKDHLSVAGETGADAWVNGGLVDLHFSSSPGMMSSVDDFYTVSTKDRSGLASNLAVLETSIDVFKDRVLQEIRPQSVLSWVRVRVATQLAQSGSDWAGYYSRHFSGTYVNQWMVVDSNRLVDGVGPQPGLLTVLEEVPGLIAWDDLTDTLIESSYWASYNLPYFPDVQQRSGAAARCSQSELECWDKAPRAMQFATVQKSVGSVRTMMDAISYNDYEHDPYSQGDSCRAIGCRQDLEPTMKKESKLEIQ
jgi:hypothetical protein